MNADERRALVSLRFDVAPVPDDIWKDSPFHVEELHGDVLERVGFGIDDAKKEPNRSPMGVVIQGVVGSGKTHLLGWVRRRVQSDGGYFFLVGLLDGDAFWQSVAIAMLEGMHRDRLGKESQLRSFLRTLCAKAGVREETAEAVIGHQPVSRHQLDEFVDAVRAVSFTTAVACQHTLRALVLFASHSAGAQDVGYSFLQSMEEMESGDRHEWGIQRDVKSPPHVVRELTHLLALTGPVVIAIDQIDTLIAQAVTTTSGRDAGTEDGERRRVIAEVADGLMSLRQETRATMTVLTTLPSTWRLIKMHATKSVVDRFHEEMNLEWIPSAEVARSIIEKRFTVRYREVGFEPRYPTWPIQPKAFIDATVLTPRRLIKIVTAHVQSCVRDGEIRELENLTLEGRKNSGHENKFTELAGSGLDVQFDKLRAKADVSAALHKDTEDTTMPALLGAGLAAWIVEIGRAAEFSVDPGQGAKPALHARLRRTLDETTDDEQHWSFRAISHDSGVAILNRIQAARTSSGLSKGISKRKLMLLRNTPWNNGPKNKAAIADFSAAGGATLSVSEDDLRTFAALKELIAENSLELAAWLRDRRPAGRTALLRAVLGEVAAEIAATEVDEPTQIEFEVEVEPSGPAALLGREIDSGRPLHVDLESLRKHTAIFAGSGSGKTVLIRRLVEECALQGVSSIVLDPNNDLARLGEGWPQPPAQWAPEDAGKAAEYLANTDVVVWTPRWEGGRPLAFQPLPDFRSVLGDSDEFSAAVDAAVASLAPRAKVDSSTAKAVRGQAVLSETVRYFARRGGEGLRDLIATLADLPDGVSQLDDASRIAFDMSQNLTAAMVTDPLFGGEGAVGDPGPLLTPPSGKRARISVISFVGLPSEQQRQSFVNQLQMALFAWIKRNPAGDRPLGGLLVMDEAQTLAPSGAMTACTQSTLMLASQARKYGLGLVFATQAPKGLHNRIPGNAATQFFGLLNAPVQIEAAREMARAKGADIPDISRLATGQFYASGEGFSFQKIRASLCLSHHPKSALTTEEVIAKAKGGA